MNVLVIGSGGREHALAWKLAQSPLADRVLVAPGNAGTAIDAENVDIPADDLGRLVQFAKQEQIGLTVVGPEAPLAAGIVDLFQSEKLRVFGPSKAAAQLEASKVFSKHLMRHADVPTADYHVFKSADAAKRFIVDRHPLESEQVPWVIKADGLASGKGVFVCRTREDALEAIKQIGVSRAFGAAGDQILIEERLDGDETSVLAITDGRTILALPPAQDHKPAYDGDEGPNTGGMGAYCPTALVTDEIQAAIESHVLVPTIHAMKRARTPFLGVLYARVDGDQPGPQGVGVQCAFW